MDYVKLIGILPKIIEFSSRGKLAFFSLFIMLDFIIIYFIFKDKESIKIKLPVFALFNVFILPMFFYIAYLDYKNHVNESNHKYEAEKSATISAKNIRAKDYSTISADDVNNSKNTVPNENRGIHADEDIEATGHSTISAGKVNRK